jgi:hypothetical protein
LFPVFLDAVKLMASECEMDLEMSLVPLTEELQKNHQHTGFTVRFPEYVQTTSG